MRFIDLRLANRRISFRASKLLKPRQELPHLAQYPTIPLVPCVRIWIEAYLIGNTFPSSQIGVASFDLK